MKPNRVLRQGALALVAAAGLLAGTSSTQAALLLHYDFESIDTVNAIVPNEAPGATVDGTLVQPGKTTISSGNIIVVGPTKYSLGTTLQFTSADGDNAEAAGHVNTNFAASSLSLGPALEYTAMAWVKWGSTSGDNMIFGQPEAGDALHLGSRNGNYHSGHWGDDLGPDQGVNVPTGTGTWHHVAFTNTAAGLQTIFVDGAQVAQGGAGTGGSMSLANNVLIGTSRNNGSFVGTVDEVRVFDTVLTPTEIQAEMIDLPVYNLFEFTKTLLTNSTYVFEITDSATSVVLTTTVALTIDGSSVTPTILKNGGVTTVTYTPPTAPDPGSNHSFTLFAADGGGNDASSTGSVRAPYFPEVVPGPEGAVGIWGVREIRNGAAMGDPGLVNSVAIAVAKPQVNDPPDPQITDGTAPVINHGDPDDPGGRGNFNNDLPFIGNQPGGDDFVIMVAKTKVQIPAAGTYTFSVHSDDGFGLRVDGGRFTSSSGGGAIDASDARTLHFVGYTGDSDTRGVYTFDAAGTYDVLFLGFEGGGGAFFEVAWAPGAHTADKDTNTWTLVGNPNDPTVLAQPFLPKFPDSIPGPTGGSGTWGVRTWLATGAADLNATFNFMTGTLRTPQTSPDDTIDAQLPRLNHNDPNGAGTGGIFGCDEPYPAQILPAASGDDENYVVSAKARIVILEEDDYTFNSHSDDGFFFRVKGVDGPDPSFKRVSGLGRFEMSNPNEMFFEAGTGDSDTRGIIHLPVGQYDLEYVMFEATGGSSFEMTVARGAFPNNADTTTWRPIGYVPGGALTLGRPGIKEPGWSVEASAVGSVDLQNSFSIAGAEAALLADSTTTLWDALNFNDPQSGGPGSIGGDVPFPRNTPNDDDNYAMRATGTLVIPVEGDYLLGFQGDDGGYLQVEGQVWDEIVENATGAGVISGDSLRTEVGTGNSRTVGRIHLAAGEYTIRTLVYEGGGGSYWEVFGVQGPVGFCYPLPLITKGSEALTATDVAAIPLVGQPPPVITEFLANVATDSYSITFTSEPGQTFTLEYSDGLKPSTILGEPGEWFQTVNVIQAEPGSTTTVEGTLSSFLTANGGSLTSLRDVFIRIRRN